MDEVGKRYGRLTVLSKSRKNSNDIWIYLCTCDCGNLKEVNVNKLHTGHIKSCGCLKHKIKNLIGERFGRLVVVDYIGRRNNKTYWRCKCDCGNICEAPTNLLTTGQKVSCGCKNEENKLSVRSFDKGLVDGTMTNYIPKD